MMVGFRPIRSESMPQGTAVRLWAMLKTAPVRPAHCATFSRFTPKLRIISGRYGKTDVKARGSANLATATHVDEMSGLSAKLGTPGCGGCTTKGEKAVWLVAGQGTVLAVRLW